MSAASRYCNDKRFAISKYDGGRNVLTRIFEQRPVLVVCDCHWRRRQWGTGARAPRLPARKFFSSIGSRLFCSLSKLGIMPRLCKALKSFPTGATPQSTGEITTLSHIERVSVQCFKTILGIYVTADLKWNNHITHFCKRTSFLGYIFATTEKGSNTL